MFAPYLRENVEADSRSVQRLQLTNFISRPITVNPSLNMPVSECETHWFLLEQTPEQTEDFDSL